MEPQPELSVFGSAVTERRFDFPAQIQHHAEGRSVLTPLQPVGNLAGAADLGETPFAIAAKKGFRREGQLPRLSTLFEVSALPTFGRVGFDLLLDLLDPGAVSR